MVGHIIGDPVSQLHTQIGDMQIGVRLHLPVEELSMLHRFARFRVTGIRRLVNLL